MGSYHFTFEGVAKCSEAEVEYWLKVFANLLDRGGLSMDDAQAIGLDGAKGAALDFPDPVPRTLVHDSGDKLPDTRRMSDVPGRMT